MVRSYHRAVRQKAALLRSGRVDPHELSTWNTRIVELGAELVLRRQEVVDELLEPFERLHGIVAGEGEVALRMTGCAGEETERGPIAERLGRSIAEASYRFGQEMEAGDRIIVGVNAYTDGNEEKQVEILQIPHSVEVGQCERLAAFKKNRDSDAVQRALDAIRDAAREDKNVMPFLVEASLANCTLGEQVQAMADIYGRYTGGPEW